MSSFLIRSRSLCCALIAFLLASATAANELSVLPDAEGVSLRLYGEVIRFDASGQRIERRSDALQRAVVGPSAAFARPSPGEPLFWALPGTETHEAVILGSTLPGAPLCERVMLEDGRFAQLLRVVQPARRPDGANEPSAVVPGAFEYGRNAQYDAVYQSGVVARGADARVLVAAPRNGGGLPDALHFAADCESVGQALPRVLALAAHPQVAGAWVVRATDSVAPSPQRFVLERVVEGAVAELIDLEGLLPMASQPAPLRGFWLKALDDGGVLLAVVAFDSAQIGLQRYEQTGRLAASAEVDGFGLAGIEQTDTGFRLAVRTEPRVAGASRVIALQSDLQVHGSIDLSGMYLHGPLASAEHGSRGADWLLSEQPWVLDHEQFSASFPRPSTGFGVGRLAEGPRVDVLQALSPFRPRLRLADGSLVATSHEQVTMQAWNLPASGGAPIALALPAMDPLSRLPTLSQVEHSQGTLRLVTATEGSELQMIEPSGALRWRASAAGELLRGPDSDRACVARRDVGNVCFTGMCGLYGRVAVECFRITDGVALPAHEISSSGSVEKGPPRLFGSVAGDGSMVVYDVRSPGFQPSPWETAQLRIGPLGETSTRVFALPQLGGPGVSPDWRGAPPQQWVQTPQGDVVVAESEVSSGTRTLVLRRLDLAGVETSSAALGDASGWVRLLAMDRSGELLLLAGPAGSAPGQGVPLLNVLSASFASLWSDRVPGLAAAAAPNALGSLPIAARTPNGRHWGVATDDRSVFLIDPASGEPATKLALPAQDAQGGLQGWALASGDAADELVLLRSGQRGLELRRLHAQSFDVGAPARLDSAQAADRSPAGLHQQGSVLYVGPVVPGDAVRTLQAPAQAELIAVDGRHTGLWYDPMSTGQGLMLDVEADAGRWFAGWFTFSDTPIGSGLAGFERSRPIWYTALGQAQAGTAALPVQGLLYDTRGGDFTGALAPSTSQVGELELRAVDCNTLEFSYRMPQSTLESSNTWRSGSRRLQRLGPPPSSCNGDDAPSANGLDRASSGSWVLEGRSSQGLLLQVEPGTQGALWGAWFGFAPDQPALNNRQHWLTVIGRSAAGQSGVVELEWMRTLGGGFDSQPTRNTRVIGTGRLRFTACDRAVLEYSFEAPGLPGDAFAGLQGQVAVRRFEPCR